MRTPRTQGASLRRVLRFEARLIAPDLVFFLLTCMEDTMNPKGRTVRRPFYLTKRQARDIALGLSTAAAHEEQKPEEQEALAQGIAEGLKGRYGTESDTTERGER